ncbi:MAG: Murein DD-endopeptidase MepM [Pseudomonas sp.]|nr:MAG: Murein DD-endopeptidase MepM [Pseudomonas sp.]
MLARSLLFCGLFMATAHALAMTLYKSVDADGVVVFSDRPSAGAQAFVFQDRVTRPGPLSIPFARIQPYRYPFPWRGGPFRLTQGPNGSFSHTEPKSRYAMDIAMPEGTMIIAARGGVVIDTENNQVGRGTHPSGNFVRVQHDDGTQGVYLHLKQGSVSVREGQRVRVGSPLALSGNTGNSSGPHLHFVVQRVTPAGLVSIPYVFSQPLQALPNFALGN